MIHWQLGVASVNGDGLCTDCRHGVCRDVKYFGKSGLPQSEDFCAWSGKWLVALEVSVKACRGEVGLIKQASETVKIKANCLRTTL